MKRWEQILQRREFMKWSLAGGATLLMSSTPGRLYSAIASSAKDPVQDYLLKYGPIDRTLGDHAPKQFFGDVNERPHKALWSLPQYLENRKIEGPIEEVPLVIVGGGVAGLFTAYTHRKQKPIVLEQALRLGGNAKGQSWRGLDYALGSAYIDEPHAGTPMDQFYKELNLDDFMVPRTVADLVEYKGKLYRNFWDGETDPAEKEKYEKLARFFTDITSEKERPFPFIPSLNAGQLESLKYYDQWDLHALLSKVVGGKLPEQLETAIEHYCWSTYAGSAKELSAPGALNFLAQEVRPIRIAAGGNARIAERLVERILKDVPRTNLRTSAIALKVKVEANHVFVTYEDAEGKLRQIKAKAAVLSCPKFVVKRILENIEPERSEKISKLRYRSYMTANLLINKKMEKQAYDVFMVGKGKTNFSDMKAAHDNVYTTDFVMGNYSDIKNTNVSVFTFFCAFPYDGVRAEINKPEAYDLHRKRFEGIIAKDILPLMKLKSSDIIDLRLTRWGHALPLTSRGIYRDDTIPVLRKPFKDRVFFVEQDNWSYPSLQTGATDTILMRDEIRRLL